MIDRLADLLAARAVLEADLRAHQARHERSIADVEAVDAAIAQSRWMNRRQPDQPPTDDLEDILPPHRAALAAARGEADAD